jgi:hypothetical protein
MKTYVTIEAGIQFGLSRSRTATRGRKVLGRQIEVPAEWLDALDRADYIQDKIREKLSEQN